MSRSSLCIVLKVGTGPWVIFIAKQRSICTRPMRIFETGALLVEGSILIDSRISCNGLILDTVTNTTHIIEVGQRSGLLSSHLVLYIGLRFRLVE